MRVLTVGLCWGMAVAGWGQAPGRVAAGSVSGRVICADTNGPARFAQVMLVPVVTPDKPAATAAKKGEVTQEISRIYQTDLEGNFSIPEVAPGNYYVLAEKSGYRSATEITREQMNHPTEAVAREMARLLTPVSVGSGRGSRVEVRVVRGAAISGRVRFDDGTADGGAEVNLSERDGKGGWKAVRTGLIGNSYGSATTNDQGEFRFAGLQAGEYLVRVTLQIMNTVVSRSEGGESWSSSSAGDLAIFAPAATREKEAKALKVGDGEEARDVEVEVPLSRLHRVEGVLAEKGNGRSVNAGKVELLFADDGKELTHTEATRENGRFAFDFVPEGDYTVKVSEAADVVRTEVPNPPGMVPVSHTDTKTVRSFGEATQALKVESDVTGLVVSVPPAGAAGGVVANGAGQP